MTDVNWIVWVVAAVVVLIVLYLLVGRGKGKSAPTVADEPAPEIRPVVEPKAAPAIVPPPPSAPMTAPSAPPPPVAEPVPAPQPVVEPVPVVISVPEPVVTTSTPAPATPPPSPAEGEDNLLRLKGVGPKIAALLKAEGVTRYSQIAAWTDADIAAIDAKLGSFAGRPRRDNWIDQASLLAAGDIAGYEAKYGKL